MPPAKNRFLRARIESYIHEIMVEEMRRIGTRESPYIRSLILKDLQAKGALNPERVGKVVLENIND